MGSNSATDGETNSTPRSHGSGDEDPSLNHQFAYPDPRDAAAAGLVHQLGDSTDLAYDSTTRRVVHDHLTLNSLFARRQYPCLDLHLENLNLGSTSPSSSSNYNYDHIDQYRNPYDQTTGSSNYRSNRPNPSYGLFASGNPCVGQFPTRYDETRPLTNIVGSSTAGAASSYSYASSSSSSSSSSSGVLPSSRAGDLSVFELMTANSGITFRNLLDDPNYRNAMVDTVTRDAEAFFEVAKDRVGIRSVVKLIDVVVSTSPVLRELVTCALAERVVDLMFHPTASRLVSHCLENLTYRQNSFLFDAALKNYYNLARSKIGSESLKNCIKFSRVNYRMKIFKKIIHRSVDLAKHPIGNFLVQSIMERYDLEVSEELCFYLKGHLEELSLDPHGSHVIEKCLLSSGGTQILQELVSFEREKLKEIANDCYGNYVIQTALIKTKDRFLRTRLCHNVRQITAELNYSPATSKLINLLKRDF